MHVENELKNIFDLVFFLSLFAYFEFIPWDDLLPCSIVEGDYWILSLYFDHVAVFNSSNHSSLSSKGKKSRGEN